MSVRDHVVIITDIPTPYYVAVHSALAQLVDLTVLFSSSSGTRAFEWELGELPYAHEVVGGLTVRRTHPDATDFYLSPRVLRTLHRLSPDVVIAGGFSFPSAYAALYCRARRIPLLVFSDGTSASEARLGRLQRVARRVVAPHAAGAIAKSEPAAQRFAELGFPPDRIFRAPHSTSIGPLHAVARARAYRTEPGVLRVLASGRLIARKGFDRLIRAIAIAHAQRPGISLRLVGSGPEDSALRLLAAELRAPVEFGGFVDQSGLPAEYAAADAYAFPTLDDPFGIVLLEAAAAGLPVITSSRAGATADLVADGTSALVADPGDVERWAASLVRLADDPALAERLGRAALEVTLGRTPDATAARYADAVAEALNGWRVSAR